jgi:hypothetical protein
MTRRESLGKALCSVSIFGDRDILIAIVCVSSLRVIFVVKKKKECGPGFLIQEETLWIHAVVEGSTR